MNVYVLKGVLLDATNAPGTTSTLKDRVFDAISFPGFINSTYDVIGVEFGLGIMELAHRDEPATVKIQIWNLNEQKNFILNWRHFLKGSRFGIITWSKTGGKDYAQLEAVIKDCLEKCPEISLGIVIEQGRDDTDGTEDAAVIESIPARVEKKFNVRATMARDLEAMMGDLVSLSLDNSRIVQVLPVRHAADLAHVPSIQNPFFNYLTRVSDNLLRFLGKQGIRIENDDAVLENEDYIFRINLSNASLHVATRQCTTCKERPCREAFTKVCVVLDSQIKKGFASDDLGLTPPDLFVLSMVFAISNKQLPSSVTSQFPKAKPCNKHK
jgi:hypothetical protein